MKQIILKEKKPSNIVVLKDFVYNPNHYYGAAINLSNCPKAYLRASAFGSGKFGAYSLDVDFSDSNGLCSYLDFHSMNSLIKSLLEDGHEVFEFENLKEFGQWIAS